MNLLLSFHLQKSSYSVQTGTIMLSGYIYSDGGWQGKGFHVVTMMLDYHCDIIRQ